MGYDPLLEDRMLDRQLRLPIRRLYDVAVVGVGGIGIWVALLATLYGARTLRLFDRDVVGYENLNRLPLTFAELGKPKTEAVSKWLQSLRPDMQILRFNEDIRQGMGMLTQAEVVFICVDNTEANNAIVSYLDEQWRKSRQNCPRCGRFMQKFNSDRTWVCANCNLTYGFTKVLRAAYDGDRLTAKEAADVWDTDDGGYNIVPSSAHYAMLPASLVFEKAVNDEATGEICSVRAKDLLESDNSADKY